MYNYIYIYTTFAANPANGGRNQKSAVLVMRVSAEVSKNTKSPEQNKRSRSSVFELSQVLRKFAKYVVYLLMDCTFCTFSNRMK